MSATQQTLIFASEAAGRSLATPPGSAVRESDIRPATEEDNWSRYGDDRIQWVWACPRCKDRVVASVGEKATPREIAADALCHGCRRKSTQNVK